MGSSVSGEQRAVIVAVGAPDRRLTDALRCASHIPAHERCAVHVDVAPNATSALGLWWMECQPSDIGLLVVDNCGGVASTLARCAAAQLARGFGEVVVLAGFWQARQARRWLLHDRTAESVCVAVNRVPSVTGVLVPVPARATRLPARTRSSSERALTIDEVGDASR